MKESSLSASTRALLDAAKSDGPGAAAHLKMWGAVSSATGIAAAAQVAAASGAGTGAAVAAASSAKLLVAGAIFGSALTVGVALAIVRVVSSSAGTSPTAESATVSSRHGAAEDLLAWTSSRERDPARLEGDAPPIPLGFDTLGSRPSGLPFLDAERSAAATAPAARRSSGVRSVQEDPLSREGALIMEARGALRRKDAVGALAALDAARRVGSHTLEAEELSVRVHTLRALGRDVEADELEGSLKARFPDQALIR